MNTKTKTSIFGVALLFIAAIIWGFAFSAQSAVADTVGPFTIAAVRFLIAGFFLIPCILFFDRKKGRHLFGTKGVRRLDLNRSEWVGGVICGVILTVASVLQQIGIAGEETDAGKAAFITALYLILVPVFGLFLGKRPRKIVWVGAVIAVLGFYLLSANIVITESGIGGFLSAVAHGGFRFAFSDIMVFLCAIVFSFHVISIDRFAEGTDGIRMSCVQFFTAGIVSLPIMLILEAPSFAQIWQAALPLLYLGIGSSGIAYTCQIVGQKYVDVSIAPIILSLESVFGAIGGAIFLQETKTWVQIVGCAIVFVAVILAQLPERKQTRS